MPLVCEPGTVSSLIRGDEPGTIKLDDGRIVEFGSHAIVTSHFQHPEAPPFEVGTYVLVWGFETPGSRYVASVVEPEVEQLKGWALFRARWLGKRDSLAAQVMIVDATSYSIRLMKDREKEGQWLGHEPAEHESLTPCPG